MKSGILERVARACTTAWRSPRSWVGWALFLVAVAVLGIVVWRITPSENWAFNAFLTFMVGAALLVSLAQWWLASRQLRLSERQQARLEEDQLRQPRLRLGLGPDCSSRLVVHPKWQPEHHYSQPVDVPVTVVNEGTRAARHYVYNLLVPHPVHEAMTGFFVGGISLGKHPPKGFTRFIYETSGLQPGLGHVQDTTLAFPRGCASYPCPFTLHVEDLAPVEGETYIEVVDDKYPPAPEEPSA